MCTFDREKNVTNPHSALDPGKFVLTRLWCTNSFASKSSMMTHHTEICKKNGSEICHLISFDVYFQILPVASEDGEKFICPICNCSLLNLHDLTIHIRSHNTQASGSQSNTCKICGKILSSQSSLDRHMLVHSGKTYIYPAQFAKHGLVKVFSVY